MATPFSIAKLNSDTLGDFLNYFDHDAFADNPGWAGCYCYYLFVDHAAKKWKERKAKENRSAVMELINAGQLRGYLAYVQGQLVAWCNAGPRRLIPGVREEPDGDDPTVGSIVCFVVTKPFRGRGIATQLLAAACEGFRQEGLRVAEAYPLKEFKSEAGSHFGPLSMYLAAGFKPLSQNSDRQIVVRKELI